MSELDVLAEHFNKRGLSYGLTDIGILDKMFSERGIKFEHHNAHGLSFSVEDGYVGFHSIFEFDNEGRLTRIAAYE